MGYNFFIYERIQFAFRLGVGYCLLDVAAAEDHTKQTTAHTYPKRRQTGFAYK
jgi:hypothetical protein